MILLCYDAELFMNLFLVCVPALGGASVLSTSPPIVAERRTFSNVTRHGFAAGHDSPALKIEDGSSPAKSNLTVNSAGTK